MKKLFFILTGIILPLAMLLTGCYSSRQKLYGKWLVDASVDLQAQGLGELVFEFTPENLMNILISGPQSHFVYSVKFEFVDDDTIRFINDTNLPSSLAGQLADFNIQGDKLTLTNSGQEQAFTRISGSQP
jgi:hypothetical protein